MAQSGGSRKGDNKIVDNKLNFHEVELKGKSNKKI